MGGWKRQAEAEGLLGGEPEPLLVERDRDEWVTRWEAACSEIDEERKKRWDLERKVLRALRGPADAFERGGVIALKGDQLGTHPSSSEWTKRISGLYRELADDGRQII